MNKNIKKRISRRAFLKKVVGVGDINKIREKIRNINVVSGLDFDIVEDASDAFSSMKKSYGMFSNVRACLVLKGDKNTPDLKEKVGYYGEELVLFLEELDLGNCWVAGTFDRDKFIIDENQTMVCVIPFGYVDKQTLKEKAIRGRISIKRKSPDAMMDGYEDAPDWVKDAMEAVVLAPSAVNRQNPHFYFKDGVVSADVEDDGLVNLVDLGIAKKHFEIEAGGIFPIGKGARFEKR